MRKLIWIFVSITVLGAVYGISSQFSSDASDRLLLLYPEDASPVLVEAWRNIAAEEGLHLDTLTNNEFVYSKKIHLSQKYKGIILADLVQTKMPELVADHIKSYVKSGGALFLMFDVGTQDGKGKSLKDGSMFADVLDLKYGLAQNPNGQETGTGHVGQDRSTMNALGIPPGKCIINTTNPPDASGTFCEVSSYLYGPLTYTYLLTKPVANSKDLLLTTTDHQFIAGVKKVDSGKILFVNLPLTNLWRTTDSMLAHTFLHYFAVDVLHLPTLAPVPNGVGGMVMNQHVESIDALDSFATMEKWGIFKQGPYSIDFTAGPGLDKLDDNQGLDVLHNTTTQAWIHYLAGLGNAIGSDGGWAHNYYGINVSEKNESEFLKYIQMNNDAMEKVLDKKVLEYVPSMGNQPNWATRYLEKEGFLGYYSTSNTGSAPTRNYRDGVYDSPTIWSFPIVPFGDYASLRDMGFAKVAAEDVAIWLRECTDFVASNHVSRLVYFHPTDLSYFPQYLYSLQVWLIRAKELANLDSFHWYTMVDIGNFLNARRDVNWKVEKKGSDQLFSATHPKTLAHQAWLVSKNACSEPKITQGAGTIKEDSASWIVVASDGKQFAFQCQALTDDSTTTASKTHTIKAPAPLQAYKGNDTGLITLWFDDASTMDGTLFLPMLEKYSYKAAVSIAVDNVGHPGYMTWNQLSELQLKGWETTSHSISNSCDFGYYTTATSEYELIQSKQIIQDHGLRADQFVMPCGYSRDEIADHFIDKHPPIVETAEKNYASFRRLSSERSNSLPLSDHYNVKGYLVTNETTVEQIQSWLAQAIDDKTWVILVFQGMNQEGQTKMVSADHFANILELIKNTNLPVVLPGQITNQA